MTTYVTQNTIKGFAFDLVTDYIDSYSGKKNFQISNKSSSQARHLLVDSAVEEILSTVSQNVLKQVPYNKRDFLKEELYRELFFVYEKEKNQSVA